jgi:hypothetical protein
VQRQPTAEADRFLTAQLNNQSTIAATNTVKLSDT